MPLVRYFAGARAAAGTSEEFLDVRTLDALVSELSETRGAKLAAVLTASSFLVDGVACHDRSAELSPSATIDVLPPFAGG